MTKGWKDVLIKPETTVLEAIKVIDATALQVALVVNSDLKLLGTVTDGDIRRGILKGLPLHLSVSEIMHKTPTVAGTGDSRASVLSMMKLKSLRHIPLLAESGQVAGLITFQDFLEPPVRDNIVVLMAGGQGSRLYPITKEFPKPLINVGNKPILETILDNFIQYGFRRFFISVNYKAEMIKKYFGDGSEWGVEIGYIEESAPLGTAGPLGSLPERPTAPVVVMNGDILTRVNFHQLLDFHQEHSSQATMCVREYDYQVPYGVISLDRHRLVDIKEKPVHRFFVNAGIYALEPEVISMILSDSYYDMPELFKELMKKGSSVTAFPIREYWLDIGRIDDLERAKLEYSEVFE